MTHLAPGPVLENLLSVAVREHNVFPLTGFCNLSCVFCSHRHNPPGTEAFSFQPLPEKLLEDYMLYLDPEKKIIIGESATRLREGEPLTHPRFFVLLRKLRKLYPTTPIQITTNGSLLDEEIIQSLAALKPLELILSLNSSSERGRRHLMGDSQPEKAIQAVQILTRYGIPFHGSLVAQPHLVGWDDLRDTVEYLDQTGAVTVRYLLPGYTRLSDPSLILSVDGYRECYRFIESLRGKLRTPILAEPPLIEDLNPVVAGIIKGSPIQKAGLLPGDQIIHAAGRNTVCRVDLFKQLFEKDNPRIKFLRNGFNYELTIYKKKNEPSGLAVAYDLDPDQVERLRVSLSSRKETLMLVSKPALMGWKIASDKFNLRLLKLDVVPSLYFGGSIECAGLLTVSDFQATLDQLPELNCYEKVLLPSIAFDSSGRDLCGTNYNNIDAAGLPVQLVN